MADRPARQPTTAGGRSYGQSGWRDRAPSHRYPESVDWSLVAGVVVSLLVVWAAIVAVLWLVRPRDARLADLVRIVPDVLRLASGLLRDRTCPPGVRLAVVGLLIWLINPIDLIPEFIPILGPLDDVVVAVLVLRYVRRRLGTDELRRRWPGTPEGYELLIGVL